MASDIIIRLGEIVFCHLDVAFCLVQRCLFCPSEQITCHEQRAKRKLVVFSHLSQISFRP